MPEGPITARSLRFCRRCHSAATSASRPKKSPASFSVKLASPGYGLWISTSSRLAAPAGADSTDSSDSARSCAERNRSSRPFARHRCTIPLSAGGTPRARPTSSEGVSSRIAVSVATVVSRRNGCFPDSSSYATTPNEKMSVRWSTGSPRTCSGDMYATVPRTCPAPVGDDSVTSPLVARQPVQLLRQAEVQELHPPVRRHEQVLGLHVTVHDPLRVRRLETVRRLGQEEEDLALRRGPPGQELPQRLALQQLRHDVRHALVRAHVEDGQDVRVTQSGDGTGLALEPLEPLRVAGHLLGQHLDRDLAPETRVPRPVDLAHPPGPELVEDLVRPEALTCHQSHGCSVGMSSGAEL